MISKTIGRYEIGVLLGRGGMAEVYRAHDPQLGRDVAIKLILPSLADEDNFERRFETEAKSVAAMLQPNIVQVYDFGLSEQGPYMVMEFVAGGTLKDRLKKLTGFMPLNEVADIIEAIGLALDYAHAKGVIHRDIKPTNILFRADGTPVLTDFGIARVMDATQLTSSSSLTGTPAYISPEQASGNPVPQSDLYSLGVVLFEMLTGRTPFTASNTTEMVLKHVQAEPPSPLSIRPDLPLGMVSLMARVLAKKPEERFQTGAALAAALKQVLAGATNLADDAPTLRDAPVAKPAQTPSKTKHRTTTMAEVMGALVGRKVDLPGQEGQLGQIVSWVGLIGVLLTALQFLLASINALSDAAQLLVRYFSYITIGALVLGALVAVRVAMASPRYRWRALAVLGALVAIGGSWGAWRIYQNNRPPKGPIVLVAEFKGCTGCPDRIFDDDIYNELLKQSDALNLPIEVRRVRESDHAVIEDTLAARELGRAQNATLVIWGNYDSATVSPQFELIGTPKGIAPLLGTDDLRSFSYNLTANTRKLEHVAFLALGLMRYLQHEDEAALSLFDRAISSLPTEKASATAEVSAEAAFFYRANTRLRLGKPTGDVVSDLERARDYDPKVPEIHHNLSIAYVNACKSDGTNALDLALKENDYVINSGRQDATVYEIRGWILGLQHEWGDAAEAYEEAVRRGSTGPDVQRALIQAYQKLGKTEEVRRISELPQLGVPLTATSALSIALNQADGHWYANAFTEAAVSYQQAISVVQQLSQTNASNTQVATLYVDVGLSLMKTKQWQAAANTLEQSLKVAPKYFGLRSKSSESPYVLLGLSYLSLGQFSKAQENLNRALKIYPCDPGTLNYLGQVQQKQNNFAEALKTFQQAAKISPQDGAADFFIATTLEALQKPAEEVRAAYQSAAAKYEALLKREPGDAAEQDVLNTLRKMLNTETSQVNDLLIQASGAIAKLDYTAAISPARQAVMLSPNNAQAHQLLGSALRRSGRDKEGLAELQTAQRLDPNNAQVYYELGAAYSQLQQFDDAIVTYHRAVELNANDGASWQQLANVLWRMGKPNDAVEPAQQAAKLQPDNPLAHGTLGMVLVNAQRYAEAVPSLNRAIELSPTYSLALQFLSGAHYRLGQLDEAINTIGKAAELDPQNADVLISYAYLLAEQGKAQPGFDMAQRAVALKPNPNNPLLQYALGVGYKAQGKTAEATTAFQAVINSTDAEPMLKDKARKQIE